MIVLLGRPLLYIGFFLGLLLAVFSAALHAEKLSGFTSKPTPYVHAYYDRGYQVFVGAGNLSKAQQVVENALYWRPEDKIWWQRYAEVCGWQSDAHGALRGWTKVAELSGDSGSWQKVRDLASSSYNHRLALRASKNLLKASPRNTELIDEITRRYELLGNPREGIDFLTKWQGHYPSSALVLGKQRLAMNISNDRKALAYYREYIRDYGVNERMAEQSALSAWRLGEREKAQTNLVQDSDRLAYSPKLESLRASIAVSMGAHEEAMSAYEVLIEHDDESAEDLRTYIVLAGYFRPDRVEALMSRAWQRSRTPDIAMNMLYQFSDRGDWQAADDFIQALTREQYQLLSAEPRFLGFHAQALMRRGESQRAMALLRHALDLAPNDQSLQREWLWLLIATGEDEALDYSLAHWEMLLRGDPRNMEALAAAHGALDDAEAALRYQGVAASEPAEWESQWNAAQALISAGKERHAWPLLYRLWAKLPQLSAKESQRLAFLNMQLTLSRYFEGGDARLIRAQGVALGVGAHERDLLERSEWLALWAAGEGENELAQAWYLSQDLAARRMGVDVSPGSRLAYAALQDDYDSVARILESSGGALSGSERLQTQIMLDQPHLAAATFADLQKGAPEQTGQNNSQEELLISAETSTAAELRRQRIGALTIDQAGVDQSFAVGDATTFSFSALQRDFASNDETLLVVNESERRAAVGYEHRHKRWTRRATLASRELLGNSATMADVGLGYRGKQNTSWNWRYQWQMPADESSLLQLGGSRSGHQIGVDWTPLSSMQFAMDWAGYDYDDLDTQQLGTGAIVNAQQTWRPWSSRFSSGLRVRYTDAQFDQQRDSMAEVKVLLPFGVNSAPLPQDYHETAVELLLGQSDLHIRPHRINAWAEISYIDNSLSGSGLNGRLGIQGTLIGRDSWRLFSERKVNSGGSDEESYLVGLQYKIHY